MGLTCSTPEYRLTGSAKVIKLDEVLRSVRGQKGEIDNRVKFLEDPIDKKDRERFDQIIKVVSEWAIDLGVDIRNRKLKPDLIHYFSPENFKKAIGKIDSDGTNDIFGRTLGYKSGIFIKRGDQRRNLHAVQHELIHLASSECIQVDQDKNSGAIRIESKAAGYRRITKGGQLVNNAINEAVTEASNIQLKKDRWPTNHRLNEFKDCRIGYPLLIILFDEMIKRCSERIALSPREVLAYLQRGMLIGEVVSLRILSHCFGFDGLRDFSRLNPGKLGDSDVYAFSRWYKFDEAVSKMKMYANGKEIVILDHVCAGGVKMKMGE